MADKCAVDPQRDCLGLAKAEMLEKQIAEYRQEARNTHAEMFKRIRELEDDRTEIKTQYGHIMEAIGGMRADIASIKEKPAKRWDAVVDKIVLLVVSACVVYILTKIGLPAA